MRVTLSGARGLVGTPLVEALRARGDEVTVLSRSGEPGTLVWQPLAGAPPAAALEDADAFVHLAGEPIAQRWTAAAREAIRTSRTTATVNLVAGFAAASRPPRVLVCANAVGYYGDRGEELLSERSAPGEDWLARLCVDWERAALAARDHGASVCVLRTGVVLDRRGGALAKMLPPFRLGVGGPVAGGRQRVAWIGLPDLCALYLAALDDARFDGPFNACAPNAATNAELARALGRALHRPALLPVPGAALRLLYGEMAQIVTASQNAVPQRALALGHRFAQPDLDGALAQALS